MNVLISLRTIRRMLYFVTKSLTFRISFILFLLFANASLRLNNQYHAVFISASSFNKKPSRKVAFRPLASIVVKRLNGSGDVDGLTFEEDDVVQSLQSLSSAQINLKRLDGIAHEAYQRSSTSRGDTVEATSKVSGRATRSAGRVGCVADGLFACELCELMENTYVASKADSDLTGVNGTLYGRKVLLNETFLNEEDSLLPVSVLVFYEEFYDGGAGMEHGGVNNLVGKEKVENVKSHNPKGRIVIVVADHFVDSQVKTLSYLDAPPSRIHLNSGLVAYEIASVHSGLYKTAGMILEAIRPALLAVTHPEQLQLENQTKTVSDSNDNVTFDETTDVDHEGIKRPAFHMVGRSLAGGVAALMASILDGTLPMPEKKSKSSAKKKKSGKKRKSKESIPTNNPKKNTEIDENINSLKKNDVSQLSGYARGRSSAFVLGPPPSLSPNVKAAYITSVIHGDDVVCRTSHDSLERLCGRVRKSLKSNFLTKHVSLLGDAVSFSMTNLKSHAHGSEGEELLLKVPGNTYLVRPRRMGKSSVNDGDKQAGSSSLHEVGGVNGREAIRAAVLWQLNDVLLSPSLWIHHGLTNYINGLDRVHLRNVAGK